MRLHGLAVFGRLARSVVVASALELLQRKAECSKAVQYEQVSFIGAGINSRNVARNKSENPSVVV